MLCNEGSRKKYDQEGMDVVENLPKIDVALFFTLLFGADVLQDFIGNINHHTCYRSSQDGYGN